MFRNCDAAPGTSAAWGITDIAHYLSQPFGNLHADIVTVERIHRECFTLLWRSANEHKLQRIADSGHAERHEFGAGDGHSYPSQERNHWHTHADAQRDFWVGLA